MPPAIFCLWLATKDLSISPGSWAWIVMATMTDEEKDIFKAKYIQSSAPDGRAWDRHHFEQVGMGASALVYTFEKSTSMEVST